MRFTITMVLIIAGFVLVDVEACTNRLSCGLNECCKSYGFFSRCKPLREEGQTCGGKFLCGCKLGLMCHVKQDKSLLDKVSIGEGVCMTVTSKLGLHLGIGQ